MVGERARTPTEKVRTDLESFSTGWLGLSEAKPLRRDDRICGVEDSATATQMGQEDESAG